MTEKTAQEIIDLLTLNGRKPEHIKNGERAVYLSDAISIVRKTLATDHQPAFKVGEYYSFATYRIDYDADTTFIFKTLETKNSGVRVIEYDNHGKELGEYVYDADSDFLKEAKPATAEQIATFKLAQFYQENNISETQKDQYRKMLSNGKMPIGPWLALQEVENNE